MFKTRDVSPFDYSNVRRVDPENIYYFKGDRHLNTDLVYQGSRLDY